MEATMPKPMIEVNAGTMTTDSANVSFATLTDSQSASSSPPPKKSPRMTGEATTRRQPTAPGEFSKKRQDWCRWPVCPEYRRTGVCSAMPEEKNGCVVGCQLAHIKPEDAVSVTAQGYTRVCFDSMGLLQTSCSRPNCTYFHPPKHIRDQIIARRHAQYLREKQTREAAELLTAHPFSLLTQTPPQQVNLFPNVHNLQETTNGLQLTAGSHWGLGSFLPFQATLASSMIQAQLNRMTPPAINFPSHCLPNSSHPITDLNAFPVNFPSLSGCEQFSLSGLGAMDLQRLYANQLLPPTQMLQPPQLWPEAAPKLSTAVPDASCYAPTDLLTLLNWLTFNQSLMAPAIAQSLPPAFQFPLPPLIHTNSSAVTLSTSSSQQQQQSPHYFPAFNAPPSM